MIEETKSKNGKKTMPDECICCTGERLDPFMDENYYCPKYTGEWDTDKQARECAYKSLTQEEVEKNRRSHGGYREVTCDECENMGEHFGLCKSCEVCHEQERTVVYEC